MLHAEPSASSTRPEVNIVFHWLGRLVLWLTGWKVDGKNLTVEKAVIIAAPHTSNLDGAYMVLASWVVRRRLDWMVKAELTRKPVLGWLIKRMGGMPIDRSASFDAVEQASRAVKQRERVLLAVAPEGTRRKTNHWKTGFYWIAVNAKVPLLIASMDYSRKVIDLSVPLMWPTGDIEQDMATIWEYYQPQMARFPEKFSDKKLRPSALRTEVSVPVEQPASEES